MALVRLGRVETGAGDVQGDATADGGLVVRTSWLGGTLTRYDAAGEVVWSSSGIGTTSGALEVLADGRILVWRGQGEFGGDDFRLFGADGVALTGWLNAAAGVPNVFPYDPLFTATPDGGWLYTYRDRSYQGEPSNNEISHPGGTGRIGRGTDLYTRSYEADGSVGPGIIFADNQEAITLASTPRNSLNQIGTETATLRDGRVVAAYYDDRAVGDQANGYFVESSITVQIFTDGVRGQPIQVNTDGWHRGSAGTRSGAPSLIGPTAIATPDGGFAVVWSEAVYDNALPNTDPQHFKGWQTQIRYFDAAGNGLTDEMTLFFRTAAMGNIEKFVWGEALSDGRIVLAFNDGINGANGNGEIEAWTAVVAPLGVAVTIQRLSPEAFNTDFYTVHDLVVRSDNTVDVIYRDAATGSVIVDRLALVDVGEQLFQGGPAADVRWTAAGDDSLYGGAGNDKLAGNDGADVLVGAAGDDLLKGGAGEDRVSGGAGADKLYGEDGADTVVAGDGRDSVYGGVGGDALAGGGGDDRLQGDAGDDTLEGGSGLNLLIGGDGFDFASYAAAAAGVSASLQARRHFAAGTEDRYSGVEGLIGSVHADTLTGDRLDNVLKGNAGADTLSGGQGNDRLVGGAGDDRLLSGAGADVFDFRGGGADTAADFDRRFDRLSLATGELFTAVERLDVNGDGRLDSVLTHDDGWVVVLGAPVLSLEGWNGLLVA